jgi:DNA-binding NtrC family response regulator
MTTTYHQSKKTILLIDKQNSWRERSAHALRLAGFAVEALDTYTLPEALLHHDDHRPDLVVLGCASVGPEEQSLINEVLLQQWHLLVLSTSLPWHTMRALFRVGANDVTDKPYDADLLVTTVNQALESIAER